MRKYERPDCSEQCCYEGQKLNVGTAFIVAGPMECDLVLVFGNPETRNAVFVPNNSVINIKGSDYRIVEGSRKRGRRFEFREILDERVECLLNEKGELRSMSDFEGMDVIVKSLP